MSRHNTSKLAVFDGAKLLKRAWPEPCPNQDPESCTVYFFLFEISKCTCNKRIGAKKSETQLTQLFVIVIYLYYKNRNFFKTFFIQMGLTLLLTPDPRINAEGGGRGWRPIKIACWRAFLPKTNYFFSPCNFYTCRHTRLNISARDFSSVQPRRGI